MTKSTLPPDNQEEVPTINKQVKRTKRTKQTKQKAPNGNGNGADHGSDAANTSIPIPKPDEDADFLEKFRSKKGAALANVESNTDALPHMAIKDAKDFVRLHNDPAYWSHELCFCIVPVKGAKKGVLHLIEEELAVEFLEPAQIIRYRLVLASKPFNIFFLCEVPTQNLDNNWNRTNVEACEKARTQWTMVTSRRLEGIDDYLIKHARNPKAFPEVDWPKVSLGRFVRRTFAGQLNIDDRNHAGLKRLIGEPQDLT